LPILGRYHVVTVYLKPHGKYGAHILAVINNKIFFFASAITISLKIFFFCFCYEAKGVIIFCGEHKQFAADCVIGKIIQEVGVYHQSFLNISSNH
jgi:hypothetical protein